MACTIVSKIIILKNMFVLKKAKGIFLISCILYVILSKYNSWSSLRDGQFTNGGLRTAVLADNEMRHFDEHWLLFSSRAKEFCACSEDCPALFPREIGKKKTSQLVWSSKF